MLIWCNHCINHVDTGPVTHASLHIYLKECAFIGMYISVAALILVFVLCQDVFQTRQTKTCELNCYFNCLAYYVLYNTIYSSIFKQQNTLPSLNLLSQGLSVLVW